VLLVIALVIIAFVVGLVKFAQYVVDSSKQRKVRKVAEFEHERTVTQLRIAEQYLRTIANGAGAPLYEAQEALDNINRLYDRKELS
jgi:hypothetical protein